jgi:hypothetical protein
MRRAPWLAICGLVVLALVGGASAITRGVAVWRFLDGAPIDEISPQDSANMQTLAAWTRTGAGHPFYDQLEATTRAGTVRYNSVPITTLAHIVPGAVFLFVAPLQLVPRFRARRPGIHRRLGYVLLALSVPYAITGIFLSVHEPGFGVAGGLASGLAGLWFVNCAVRAYVAIRRRDIVRHREWMLRAMAVAYGIAIVRLLFLAIVVVVPIDPMALGAFTFWAGWLLAVLPTEWWIRRTTHEEQALRWAS